MTIDEQKKISDIVFRLRQFNSELMQDFADDLESIINESEVK